MVPSAPPHSSQGLQWGRIQGLSMTSQTALTRCWGHIQPADLFSKPALQHEILTFSTCYCEGLVLLPTSWVTMYPWKQWLWMSNFASRNFPNFPGSWDVSLAQQSGLHRILKRVLFPGLNSDPNRQLPQINTIPMSSAWIRHPTKLPAGIQWMLVKVPVQLLQNTSLGSE